jgi:endogenous inhibitor of DNA gyrase (YacG/DUF329 family)
MKTQRLEIKCPACEDWIEITITIADSGYGLRPPEAPDLLTSACPACGFPLDNENLDLSEAEYQACEDRALQSYRRALGKRLIL